MESIVLVKAIAVTLWLLASAKAGVLALATDPRSPDYVNVVLNFASLAILVGGLFLAPKALRARSAQSQLAEKDQIISTANQLRLLKEEELRTCKDRMRDIGFELDAAQRDHALWRGRYEEQQKYTAQPALEAITKLLETTNQQNERRHQEMLAALARIPVADEG